MAVPPAHVTLLKSVAQELRMLMALDHQQSSVVQVPRAWLEHWFVQIQLAVDLLVSDDDPPA
jgi:hypothetical protein